MSLWPTVLSSLASFNCFGRSSPNNNGPFGISALLIEANSGRRANCICSRRSLDNSAFAWPSIANASTEREARFLFVSPFILGRSSSPVCKTVIATLRRVCCKLDNWRSVFFFAAESCDQISLLTLVGTMFETFSGLLYRSVSFFILSDVNGLLVFRPRGRLQVGLLPWLKFMVIWKIPEIKLV